MIALLTLPRPLHPALVHFPIVLVLLGAAVAVAAAIVPRWRLPLIAAVLLGLGAVGSVIAVQTGERDGELVNETPALERVLEQHEEWAERTQSAAIIASILAVGAVVTFRWPAVARGLNVVTAVSAMAATWCVVETGHYGGQLVYQHGAGVGPTATTGGERTPAERSVPTNKKHREDHE